MKHILLLILATSIISCSHTKQDINNLTTIEIILADGQCLSPVVSSEYYFEAFKAKDKKKIITDTKLLNGRTTVYQTKLDKGMSYVFSIKKQPDSELITRKTVKFKKQKKISLYHRLCD